MPAPYAVTLERGADGTYLAWVDDLPGCAVRAPSRDEVLERLPGAIREFLAWSGEGEVRVPPPEIRVVEEVASAIATEEDTEALVEADRRPLAREDWARMQQFLARSREELLDLLGRQTEADLAAARSGSERTVREEVEHVAFVELMYAVWTFDLRTATGLADFLAWTRGIASERLGELAARGSDELTWAGWRGAPRPEPWTPRKAGRRLVWHELLHLRALEGFAGDRDRL